MGDGCAHQMSAKGNAEVAGAPVPDATESRTSATSLSMPSVSQEHNPAGCSTSFSLAVPQEAGPERTTSRYSVVSDRSRLMEVVSKVSPMFSQYIVAVPENDLEEHPSRLALSQIVDSNAVQVFMAIVTLVSFVDVVADTDARSLGKSPPEWFPFMHHLLFLAFFVELVARLFVEGRSTVHNLSTVADIVVVLSGMLEYLLILCGISTNLATLRILRLSRLLKLSRVVFRVPCFYELRKMIAMIGSCFKTLFWSVLVLSAVLTAWSVVAVELLNPLVKELVDKGHWSGCTRCPRAFRTVFECNVTFFQTIVAGDSWGKMAIPIIEAHPWTALIFVGALLTVVFGVLNVVVAVVVDSFAEAREKDIFTRAHEMAMEEKREKKALQDIFDKVDKNGDGTLDLSELKEGAARVEMFSHWLRVLDIDAKDLEEMFSLLDRDGSGDVDASEFIEFMYRLKNSEARTATQFVKAKVSQLVEQQQAADSVKTARSESGKVKLGRRDSGIYRTSSNRTCSTHVPSRTCRTLGSSTFENLDALGIVPEAQAFGSVDEFSHRNVPPSGASRFGSNPPSAVMRSKVGESPRSMQFAQSRAESLPFLSDLCSNMTNKPLASAAAFGSLARAPAPDTSELFSATIQRIDAQQEELISLVKQVHFNMEPRSSSPPAWSALSKANSPSPRRVKTIASDPLPRPRGRASARERTLPLNVGSQVASPPVAVREVEVLPRAPFSAVREGGSQPQGLIRETSNETSKESSRAETLSEASRSPGRMGSRAGRASPGRASPRRRAEVSSSPGRTGSREDGVAAVPSPPYRLHNGPTAVPQALRPVAFLLQDNSVAPPSCYRSPSVGLADIDLESQSGAARRCEVEPDAQRRAGGTCSL